jgi:hypothetical protein
MPSCVSCGAAVQVDELRRFARCACGATVPLAAAVDREIETIVRRLKRLEDALAADADRLAASCAQLDAFPNRRDR